MKKKIGVSISTKYEEIIKDLASANGVSETRVCSLILENQLNYYMRSRSYPLFDLVVEQRFQDKISEDDLESLQQIAKTPWLDIDGDDDE